MNNHPTIKNDNDIQKFLGEPVTVDEKAIRQCREKGDFGELAFNLYKEAGLILNLCAHTYIAEDPEHGFLPRNQAICAGLLIRITKFMTAVIQLTSTAHRGDVVLALNRCILESTANLRFLALKNEDRFYDQFVRFSLGPERELYDAIQSNIQSREQQRVLPTESRMLKSIERVCRLSNVTIEEINQKYGDWGGGLRNRLKALGEESNYLYFQRLPSHEVHGTWVDLVQHHLEEKNQGFVPDPTWTQSDARLLSPIAFLVLEAARQYLEKFFGAVTDLQPVSERIEDLKQRISLVDEAHETWLSERNS